MKLALLCSLAGAGVGSVVGWAMTAMVVGGGRDMVAISFFVGVFLAGCGAIAGAIIGWAAECFKRKEPERRDAKWPPAPQTKEQSVD
jgi:hypothetical protein